MLLRPVVTRAVLLVLAELVNLPALSPLLVVGTVMAGLAVVMEVWAALLAVRDAQ